MSADIREDEQAGAPPLSVQQAESFWKDFSAQLPQLEALAPQEFVERAYEVLAPYAPDLSIELEGKPKEAGTRLVVTAHGSLDQFENVQTLVRHAPRLPHYEVHAFRSRSRGSDFAMHMNDFELSCSDVLVAHYDAGGVVGLELAFEKIIPTDMLEHAHHMAFIMLDHVLGEWDFAVRVGPVEFVDAFSDEVAGAEPLSVFPPIFDAFLREELGRSYAYPNEQDDSWSSLEVRLKDSEDDDPPDLLTFRDSANAVATRADFSHYLEWRFPCDSQEALDAVRDAHDALDAELERGQRGILVYTRMEQMRSRVAAFYVDDPEHAAQLAHRLGAQFAPGLAADLHVEFDPSWREYLALYGAIHLRHGDDAETAQ